MESTEKPIDSIGIDKQPDPVSKSTGVLLSDAIKSYNELLKPPLIEDADLTKFLRPAGYDLRLDDKYYQDGFYRTLTEKRPILTIKPHGMVVVGSYEKLHLPRYLIGRWSLRVKLVYAGLLWSGGAQVDPGFSGRLYCPLYNLSNTEVTLRRMEHVFTIDFVKTSEFDENNLTFPQDRLNRLIDEYVPPYPLKSSVAELQDRVEKTEVVITRKVDDLQSALLVGLSVLIAGLAIVATLPSLPNLHPTLPPDLQTWFFLTIGFSSLIMSIFSVTRTKKQPLSSTVYADLAVLETELRANVIDRKQYEKKKSKIAKKLRGWLRGV